MRTAAAILELRERKRKSLGSFQEWLPKGLPYLSWNYKHTMFMIKSLQPVIDGKESYKMYWLPPQHGKALDIKTKILTTSGWKEHGNLKVGEYVFNDEGKPVRILANSGIYDWHINKLTFAGGETILAADEHLWKLHVDYDEHKGRREIIQQTNKIFARRHRRNPYIQIAPCLQFKEKKLLIDPYLLGIWLGNGTSTCGNITCWDKDINNYSSLGKITKNKNKNTYIIFPEGLRVNLKKLGLLQNKHIPINYILSSKKQRLELLRGLMDTDGTVDKKGRCSFSQKVGQLGRDVYVLLRTLGFKPTIIEHNGKINGRIVGRYYNISFTPNKKDIIFKLKRKQDRIINKIKPDREDKYKFFLTKIESIGLAQVNCIQVEGGMYLAGESLIPTHNSWLVTKAFPAYLFHRNPMERIIIGAYNMEYASSFSTGIHRILEDTNFKNFSGKQRAYNWETNARGFLKAFGMQSGITGTSADKIIIDDPVKGYRDAFSQTVRDSTWNAYIYDICTRQQKNTSHIIIQTRWHCDDLSGRLLERDGRIEDGGKWEVICLPALAEEDDPLGREIGEPLCSELHPLEELLELRKNEPSMFQALYQQNPTLTGGNIIDINKFNYYDPKIITSFDYKIMSIDGAWKDKEENDYSVCTTWGTIGDNYYLIDIWRDKVKYPVFKPIIKSIFDKQLPISLLVEDAASGIPFIQELEKSLPIHPIKPEGSKEVRAHMISDVINSGRVYLPEGHALMYDFLQEISSFPKGKHDDMCFAAGTKIATLFGNKNIEDIKLNDLVITPFGLRKVIKIGCTGTKAVINYKNTFVTSNHPYFTYKNGFTRVDTLSQDLGIDIMSFRGLIKWQYKKLLYSMALNTGLWGREGIILASQQKLMEEKMLKDFMWRFGNFTAERKYKKAILFTIRTVIILIMNIAIWSAFQGTNILRYILRNKKVKNYQKNVLNILKKLGKKLHYGIEAKQEENGINNMQKYLCIKIKKNIVVHFVKKILKVIKSKNTRKDFVQKNVAQNGVAKMNLKSYEKNVLSVLMNSTQKYQILQKEESLVGINAEQNLECSTLSRKVYNLTISLDHVYYANGILVSNCDTMTQALRYLNTFSSKPFSIF
jgi:predicted phage terminase large subunit-like protein